MKKCLAVLLTICLCLGCVSVSASAVAEGMHGREKTTLFVRFEGDGVLAAAAKGQDAQKALKRTQKAVRSGVKAVQDATDDAQVLHTYTHALNGVTIETQRRDAAELRALDGVTDVIEIGYVRAVREPVGSGARLGSVDMIGADEMRALGYDGAGTAVAVIDGGFQWDHEAMTLTDESAAKYSKDDIAAIIRDTSLHTEGVRADDVYKSAKVPFAYDYYDKDVEVNDLNDAAPDHGTHVSGIAAGNSSSIEGVAPEAQVLMFKINVIDNEIFLGNLLSAIDDAAKFDIAAMNMSVGMDFEIPNDPAHALLCEAVTNARENGILVCAAAGNSAITNTFTQLPDNGTNGIPNGIPDASSIASVENLYSESAKVGVKALHYDEGKSVLSLASTYNFPAEGTLAPVAKRGLPGDLKGKIALIYDVTGDVNAYILKIANKCILGLIVPESLFDLAATVSYSGDIEVVVVADLDAYRLYHSKSQFITTEFAQYHSAPAAQPQVSDFSSYGVSDDLRMTVDMAAPGGTILSAITGGMYEFMGGTSMASPHVTGAAALLRQSMEKKYPSLPAAERADLMENLLMSTAEPVVADGVAASPRAVGAGLIHIGRAAAANAVLTDKSGHTALNLGDGIEDTFDMAFTVKNVSDKDVRYDHLDLDVITDDYEISRDFDNYSGVLTETPVINRKSVPLSYTIVSGNMPRSFTLHPGETRMITLTVSLDAAELAHNAQVFTNGFYVEGYIRLSNLNGAETALSMPFMGFHGDWLASPAIICPNEYVPGELYEPDMYLVMRTVRSLTIELIDQNGNAAAEKTLEWVKKGTAYNVYDALDTLDVADLDEGTYSLRYTAVLNAPGAASHPQVFEGVQTYSLDKTALQILSVSSSKQADGSYTIEITTNDSDVCVFDLYGRTLLHMAFTDCYPTDGYDHVDADGNYVYVLEGVRLDARALVIRAQDLDGDTAQYHHFTPLTLFVRAVAQALRTVKNSLTNLLNSILSAILLPSFGAADM